MDLLRGGSSSWLTILVIPGVLACGGVGDGPAAPRGEPGAMPPASAGTSASRGNAAAGSSSGVGQITAPVAPVTSELALTATRKVKNLLVGLSVNDSEVASVTAKGAAGLQQLITTWLSDPTFEPLFRAKMLVFFRNAFQQTGFTPTEDFKPQLLQNGGFDFGPFGKNAVGDDAFARLVQNLQDSFALTVLGLVSEHRPLTEVLTTRRYMMTTALKSLYLQIEMPNDQPFSFVRGGNSTALKWKLDYSGNAIPLEQTLDPSSPNFMVFDDQAPTTMSGFGGGGGMFQNCRGGTTMDANGAAVTSADFTGNAMLFQRLLGFTPRFPFSAQPTCWEHASKPYFSATDLSDWKWVSVRPLNDGEAYLKPYDLPTLRNTNELALKLPRVGFYTTPAFLALWNTNDSNQHRVTANQTLLVALGMSFTSESVIIPLSEAGLDSGHAVVGSECYGCHKTLDPMREFWGTQLDFNDRNDYPTRGFMMTAANPRPKTSGGAFAFGNVNATGATLLDIGPLISQVAAPTAQGMLSGFAAEMTRKLCFYANSDSCKLEDPEFLRIAHAFQDQNYDFMVLVKELFASPLVTGLSPTQTFVADAMPVSIARRDHLCAALSNRLSRPDVCALEVPLPSQAQSTTARIAGTVAADAFSRGAESPITPADPTLFYRAASEMLCENVANQVVDGPTNSLYMSSAVAAALPDMVERLMGYPPSHPLFSAASAVLQRHHDAVLAQNRRNPTLALRSAFVLACESPTALGIGL